MVAKMGENIPVKEFERLVSVMRRVKVECPWDRQQTHESIRQYLIEESYEVIDAIDDKDDESLVEELGDVQCQVLFHSLLAEERGKFTLEDVCRTLADKLVRRHPHVFKDTKVKDSDEVLKNWEHIKMKEGKKNSVLDGVPKELPALLKASRIQNKAGRVGFDWDDPTDIVSKIHEEFNELQESLQNKDPEKIEDELGDLLFSIVNLARKIEISPEDALRKTTKKFINRFQYIESTLKEQGIAIKEATLEEMDRLWDEAKTKEE